MGIIKTAMMSGAAMYGVNQIVKATDRRRTNNDTAPRRDAVDPEYLEYLEWKSKQQYFAQEQQRQQIRDEPSRWHNERQYQNPDGYRPRQNLVLSADEQGMPPYYSQGDYYNQGDYNRQNQNQPMEFVPARHRRQASGFVEPEDTQDYNRDSRGLNSLLDQGLRTLQSQGGRGDSKKGDFLDKFLSK